MDNLKDLTIEFVNIFEKSTGRIFSWDDDFAKTCFCFYAISIGFGFIKYISEHPDEVSKILSEVLYGKDNENK